METFKKDPLELDYYDEALSQISNFIEKNEDLYNELHEQFQNNQNAGFSLGSSKTSVETARTLSTIRATALTGAKILFDAKRSLGDLEIKKRQTTIDESKVENDKAFIRQTLAEISSGSQDSKAFLRNPIIKGSPTESIKEKKQLEEVIKARKLQGEIELTKNEKAMKYDDMVIPVLDGITGEIKAVEKDTFKEIVGYPIERFQINKVIKADDATKTAYTDKKQTIPIVNVLEKSSVRFD